MDTNINNIIHIAIQILCNNTNTINTDNSGSDPGYGGSKEKISKEEVPEALKAVSVI